MFPLIQAPATTPTLDKDVPRDALPSAPDLGALVSASKTPTPVPQPRTATGSPFISYSPFGPYAQDTFSRSPS